jgi:uncharacterized protein (TIGR00251 family)
MVEVEGHPQGAVFGVRASAGARKNGVTGEHDGRLKVSVTQAPEKGKANGAILEVLAQTLKVKRSQLELLAGETSPQKRFLVRDVTPEELAAKLAAVLGSSH